MTDILQKFIKNIKNLENYYVLKEEPNYLIIGKEIIIKRHHEKLGNIFMPYYENVEKSFSIIFLLVLEEDNEVKKYKEKNIPILAWPAHMKSVKIEIIKKYLDDYIELNIMN